MKTCTKLLLILGFFGFSFLPEMQAQFDVGADFVSRYLWRGQLLANGPAMQPYLSFTPEIDTAGIFGLEIGAWGSYGLSSGFDGTEADLYLTLTAGPFGFTFTDYFFPSDQTLVDTKDNYFTYGPNEETGHIFEGMLSFSGVDNFPLSASVGYNFKGADLDKSVFVDFAYPVGGVELGLSLGNGFYTHEDEGDPDSFNVVNISVGYTKEIELSQKFSLPVFGKVAVNPDLEKFYLVFGISF